MKINKEQTTPAPIKVAGLILLLLLMGACGKIEPGQTREDAINGFSPTATAMVENQEITDWYEAVGTVRPRTETSIEAQVTAQVLDIRVNPGSPVAKGQLLISLDSRQLKSRLDQAGQAMKTAMAGKEQARQAVLAAEAAFRQAESAFKRTKTYFDSQAATASELEKAESAYLQAKAGVERAKEGLAAADSGIRQAREVVKEAEIAMGYTRITAPEDGVVLQRFTDPGDLALPGKPLLTLRTAGSLRLEAFVREGLISRAGPGQELSVTIQTLEKTMDARVEEVVPYADPQSRTFLVKAALPQIEGLFPGMFGKLMIPVGSHKVAIIPRKAIRRVGQLELVYVMEGDAWVSRFIKTGRALEDKIEVLSGLSGNETIGWEEEQNV